jgi:hypothetical protein
MAFFDTAVNDLLIPSLHEGLADMTWGSRYGAIFGLMQKSDESGSSHAVVIDLSFGGGQSADYATALANTSLVNRAQFLVTPFKGYGLSRVPLDQNQFTKGPESAAVLLMDESEKAINSAKNGMDVALASDGYGTLGVIVTPTNTSGSTWTVTFALQSEVLRFRPNMVVTQKDTAAGTLQVGTGLITNVNVGTKTITLTARSSFTPTATYFMGQSGTQATGTAFTTYPGIPVWIPPAASRPVSATTLYGVDRSVDEQKLAGSYLDGTAGTILEGVLTLEAQIANVPGAMPDTLLMSTNNKAKILSDCQTQKRYVETREIQGPGITVYFKTVSIQGVTGLLDIVESSNWPDNLVAVLDRSTWFISSPGNTPIRPINSNGSPIVEDPASDTCITRFRSQAFIYCTAPGHNGMLTVRA